MLSNVSNGVVAKTTSEFMLSSAIKSDRKSHCSTHWMFTLLPEWMFNLGSFTKSSQINVKSSIAVKALQSCAIISDVMLTRIPSSTSNDVALT